MKVQRLSERLIAAAPATLALAILVTYCGGASKPIRQQPELDALIAAVEVKPPTLGQTVAEGHVSTVLVGAFRPDRQAYACVVFVPENFLVPVAGSDKGSLIITGKTAPVVRSAFVELVPWDAAHPSALSFTRTEEELNQLLEYLRKTGQ